LVGHCSAAAAMPVTPANKAVPSISRRFIVFLRAVK
jgi:hypothetical protein